jgi:ribonuclease BN (tRNA processing enzyme)
MAQALDLVKEIKPWRTVLTHFSQRYKWMPEILEQNKKLKVLIALDHMRLRLKHFDQAYRFIDVWRKLFKE